MSLSRRRFLQASAAVLGQTMLPVKAMAPIFPILSEATPVQAAAATIVKTIFAGVSGRDILDRIDADLVGIDLPIHDGEMGIANFFYAFCNKSAAIRLFDMLCRDGRILSHGAVQEILQILGTYNDRQTADAEILEKLQDPEFRKTTYAKMRAEYTDVMQAALKSGQVIPTVPYLSYESYANIDLAKSSKTEAFAAVLDPDLCAELTFFNHFGIWADKYPEEGDNLGLLQRFRKSMISEFNEALFADFELFDLPKPDFGYVKKRAFLHLEKFLHDAKYYDLPDKRSMTLEEAMQFQTPQDFVRHIRQTVRKEKKDTSARVAYEFLPGKQKMTSMEPDIHTPDYLVTLKFDFFDPQLKKLQDEVNITKRLADIFSNCTQTSLCTWQIRIPMVTAGEQDPMQRIYDWKKNPKKMTLEIQFLRRGYTP